DLAGLIVIDFIDMDEKRNNRTVERRLKEALRNDRARTQVGRISHFGLLEMSRQRIRTSVLESSTEKCPVCGGSGHVRSVSSVTLALLRSIEETLLKGATHNLIVRTRPEVALYILNQKRGHLRLLEERFQINITVNADAEVVGTQSFVIDRGEMVHSADAARAIAAAHSEALPPLVDEADAAYVEEPDPEAEAEEHAASAEGETADADEAGSDDAAEAPQEFGGEQSEGEGGPRRRRRRRGGRGRGRGRDHDNRGEQREPGQFASEPSEEGEQGGEAGSEGFDQPQHAGQPGEGGENGDPNRRRRRRGRRGGRRNRHRNGENGQHPREQHGESQFEPRAEQNFGRSDENGGNDTPAYAPPAPTAAVPSSEPAAQETPRRRSTVREPAPVGQSWAPASTPSPAPQPAPSAPSASSEDGGQPKRGWWGKRLLGGKD
ncbi:MAG: ribonuclease E/G, partial [Pseudolabrys sp.]|nr:ribonuclease E/G [Pseudolabrys sp.]